MATGSYWKYATRLDVHGLNNLLLMTTLLCFIRAKENPIYYKAIFAVGILAITNKMLAIIILPILLFTFVRGCNGCRYPTDAIQAGVLCTLVHLYIPISAR